MKILVVDDDTIAQAVADKVLQSDGHEVTLAEDGEEAMDILRKNEIQIVISDWNMPNMDGIELCKYIRSTLGPSINVIMVTARNSMEDMVQGLKAGANDFITKPFEPEILRLRVRNAEQMLALQTTELTLELIVRLAESKDTEDTGPHLDRVRTFAKLLAEQMMKDAAFRAKVHPRFADLLYRTSPHHDIGKIGIPDTILLKPGILNDEEWVIMKRHTTIGASTFSEALKKYPSADFLQLAYEITLCHHERWDGSGYPNGLKGEDIPISARIVALADVYDAVVNKRVYKSAFPHDVAKRMIMEQSGKHFDPAIVQAFSDCEKEFASILEQYNTR